MVTLYLNKNEKKVENRKELKKERNFMFQKVLKTTRGKWSVALFALAIISVGSILKGETDNQAVLGTVELVILSLILYYSARKTICTPASTLWAKWNEVPMNEAQSRRFDRAIECGFTPKTINLDAKFAIIVGSEGKAYKTTLTKCTCPDFKKRRLPCKHMYFLAVQTKALD